MSPPPLTHDLLLPGLSLRLRRPRPRLEDQLGLRLRPMLGLWCRPALWLMYLSPRRPLVPASLLIRGDLFFTLLSPAEDARC